MKYEKRAEHIEALSKQIQIPKEAVFDQEVTICEPNEPSKQSIVVQAFNDPDPFNEVRFPSAFDAKLAIAEFLGLPLATLPLSQLEEINELITQTLDKKEILNHIRLHIQPTLGRSSEC